MIGFASFLPRLPLRVWIVGGLIAAALAGHWLAVNAAWRRGYDTHKTETIAASAKAEAQRSQTDEAVRDLPDADLRRALGEWVRER